MIACLVVFLLLWLAYRARRLIAVAVLFLVFCVLGGCADHPDLYASAPPSRVELQAQAFMPDQLTCAAEPAAPPKPRTPAAVGRYITDLQAAGADCRGALGAVRDRVEEPKP